MSSKDNIYFAKKDAPELVKDCMGRIDMWNNAVGTGTDGIAAVWLRNLRYYYSNILAGNGPDSSLGFGGSQGELVKMFVPQARSLNQQFLSLTTKQKLNFQPISLSKDMASLNAARLGQGLSRKIVRDQMLDNKAYLMAEQASLIGFGYLSATWDFLKGVPAAVSPFGSVLYSGALRIENPLPTEVIFDFTKPNFYDNDSVLIRRPRNKWDLIQRYPHLEEDILQLETVWDCAENLLFWYSNLSDDYVWVYEFYHRSTPALEEGRMTIYGDENTIFEDGENPYKSESGAYLPIAQMKPESVMGTGFGYPMFSNILPMQEMLDHQFSAAATNNAAQAVQSVLNPYGNDLSVKQIMGMRFIQYKPYGEGGGGKPEAMQLTATAPETYKFADMLRSYMMEVYNVNSALRGTPPPGVTAAKAIATLTANALEFTQSFTKSYVDALSITMTQAFYAYHAFATEKIMVEDLGPYNIGMQKEFKKDSIASISRVDLQVSNPLMATAAGRFELAESLASKGMLQNVQGYFRVLEGAPPDVLYEEEFTQENFIAQENEDLKMGKPVFALLGIDNDEKHIKGHSMLLNSTEARRDGDFVSRTLAHIAEHRQNQMIASGQQPPMGAPPQQALPPGEQPAPDVDMGGMAMAEPNGVG